MIYHLVWFKLKEGITPEEKATLKGEMEAMIPQIPEIVELHAGEDFSGRSRGYGWGLYVKFKTKEDGQVYDKHPVHQAFIAKCKSLWIEVQALDFEA